MDRPSRRISGSSSGTGKPSSSSRHRAVPGSAGSGSRAKEGSGIRRPAEPPARTSDSKRRAVAAPPPVPTRPSTGSSSRIARGGSKPHFPNPVETASNANPLTGGATKRRGANRARSDKGNPMIFVWGGIGLVVLAVGIFLATRGSNTPSATKTDPVSSGKLQAGIVLTVKDVQWKTISEGVWSVSGTLVNLGDTRAENIVVAFYPCGPDPRIKDKTGVDIAVVTAAKVVALGPGASFPFVTTPNPPALRGDGSMSVFAENHSPASIACKDGTPLPGPMQEALFDPLDREDWGGTETDWAKKRKKGSGAH